MNKIIKFRGKRIDNGEWVYGSLHHIKGIANIREIGNIDLDKTYILSPNLPDYSGWSVNDTFFPHEVDPKTIGQYFGFLSKDKKEVYEGDILKGKKDDLVNGSRFTKEFMDLVKKIDTIYLFPEYAEHLVIGLTVRWYSSLPMDVKKRKNQLANFREWVSVMCGFSEIIGNIIDNPELQIMPNNGGV